MSALSEGLQDDETQTATTALDIQEMQWRAGVNRQAMPGANEHQRLAAQSLGAIRKAKADTPNIRRAKAAERMRRKRAAAACEKQARLDAQNQEAKQECIVDWIYNRVWDLCGEVCSIVLPACCL